MNAQILDMDLAGSTCLISAVSAEDAGGWNAYVAGHQAATFFHRFEWGSVIEKTYGHRPVFLMAKSADGVVTGILPLIHVKTTLFGSALISTAFTVGGGVLADDTASEQALMFAAARLGEERGVDYVELRGGNGGEGWLKKSETYAGFVADIPADEDENLKMIPRKKRADVRKGIKAEAEGSLTVDRSGDIDRFYALYAESVRNLGTPVLPKRLITNLVEAFGEAVDIAVIRAGGEPVAALASFWHKDTVLPYYGGAAPAARQLHAYDFMYWSQMRHAISRGCRQFDFGRSKAGTGAYDYKRYWGFEPQPLTYHYNLVKAEEMPDVNPNNPKFRLLTKTWQKLPLPVANIVGPFVAGQLG